MASSGVNFPQDGKGGRSTTGVNSGCFAAAVKRHNPALAKEIEDTKSWRFGYVKHVTKQVELACEQQIK